MKKLEIHFSFYLFFISLLFTSQNYYVFLVFLFLLLHEIMHIIVIMYFKIEINKIVLMPLGATIDCKIENRSLNEELWIYLAGILMNLIIAIFLVFFNVKWEIQFLNLSLMAFNLLPIYPLDGYRVFTTIYAYFSPYKKVLFYPLLFSMSLIMVLLIINLQIKSYNIGVMLFYLFFQNIVALKNKKYRHEEFLMQKYLHPNHYLKNKEIQPESMDVCESFFRGKNNYVDLNKRIIKEKKLLEIKYPARKNTF